MARRSLLGISGQIGELLTCQLCFERYDDSTRAAKFLPCLHGFCVQCLGQCVEGKRDFKCPICRRNINVPKGGAQTFPDNFIVSKLKDLEHLINVDTGRPQSLHCGSCKERGVAVGFCSDADCLTFLCEDCKLTHGKLLKFDGHVVCSMEQLQQQPEISLLRHKPQCEQHKQERLSLFCNDEECQRTLCLLCSATGHRNHSIITLDQKSSEVKKELQSLTKVVRTKTAAVQEIAARIKTDINYMGQLSTEKSAEVTAVFETLQRKLNTTLDDAIAEVRKLCGHRTDQLRLQTDRAKLLASQLHSACEFAERACDIGNPVDLLETRGQIISRLHELIGLDISTSLSFKPASDVFLSPTKDLDKVLLDFDQLLRHLVQLHTSTSAAAQNPEYKIDFPGREGSVLFVKAVQRVQIRAQDHTCAASTSLSGRVNAFLLAPDGSSTGCTEGKQCDDYYELEIQPLVTGMHQLNIDISGVPIAGSPFQVEVVGGPSPIADYVEDQSARADSQVVPSDATWTDAFIMCEHTLLVKFRGPESLHPKLDSISARYFVRDRSSVDNDTFEVEARVPDMPRTELAHSSESKANISATEEEGTFRISYTPSAAGNVIMTVLTGSKPISCSPITILVHPLYPDSTLVSTNNMGKLPQLTAVLDLPYSVNVLTRDFAGNPLEGGGYNVTASTKIPGSPDSTTSYDILDNQNGSYKITFTPRLEQKHVLNIQICGHPVNTGMPLEVAVRDSLPFCDPPDGYNRPSGMAVDKDRHTVYVSDTRQACKFYRLSTDGSVVSEQATSLGKRSLQIAVNNEGKLVLLIPHSKMVKICDTNGQVEREWPCKISKPANLALSKEDHVIVGDSELQALFIYRPNGKIFGRIDLPKGSLVAGMNNVCVDRNNIIIVATHSDPSDPSLPQVSSRPVPLQILRFTLDGKAVSTSTSPSASNQLAVASTPEGALVVSFLGGIRVLDFSQDYSRVSVVKEFLTDYIYTRIDLTGDGCFVAFDPGEKHLAKYSYRWK